MDISISKCDWLSEFGSKITGEQTRLSTTTSRYYKQCKDPQEISLSSYSLIECWSLIRQTMASSSKITLLAYDLLPRSNFVVSDSLPYLLFIVLATTVAYSWTSFNSSLRKLPIINPPKFFSASEARVSKPFRVFKRKQEKIWRFTHKNRSYI
jgi:hypothetical protein